MPLWSGRFTKATSYSPLQMQAASETIRVTVQKLMRELAKALAACLPEEAQKRPLKVKKSVSDV